MECECDNGIQGMLIIKKKLLEGWVELGGYLRKQSPL